MMGNPPVISPLIALYVPSPAVTASTGMPEPEHINLTSHMAHVVSAAEAVREGIATHAEKEEIARDTARRSLEAQNKLTAPVVAPHVRN